MNPILVPVQEYMAHQWAGAVRDLRKLVTDHAETPARVDAIRVKWGLTSAEIEAARLDARLEEQ